MGKFIFGQIQNTGKNSLLCTEKIARYGQNDDVTSAVQVTYIASEGVILPTECFNVVYHCLETNIEDRLRLK